MTRREKIIDCLEGIEQGQIKLQEKTGTIILPVYCEALYIPPDMDVKIKVLGKGEIG